MAGDLAPSGSFWTVGMKAQLELEKMGELEINIDSSCEEIFYKEWKVELRMEAYLPLIRLEVKADSLELDLK